VRFIEPDASPPLSPAAVIGDMTFVSPSHPRRDEDFLPLSLEIGFFMQVLVRDNNVDQALRVLKKKLQREGVFREMKLRRAYEKPSEKRVRERAEAIRRARKLARKKLQREGLLPAPKPRERPARPGHPALPTTPSV